MLVSIDPGFIRATDRRDILPSASFIVNCLAFVNLISDSDTHSEDMCRTHLVFRYLTDVVPSL